MTDGLVESVERTLLDSPEPLSARVLATRLLDAEMGRDVIPYDQRGAFEPGDRIAWQSPAGQLIGDVVSCERVGQNWRLVIDWDRKVSPGLDRYMKARKDVRLSYLFDPSGVRPSTRVDPLNSSGDGPSLLDLLETDLEEQLPLHRAFVSWKGQWTTWRQMPRLDQDELHRCLLGATADDGIAQTNQVLELMRLPGPNQPRHGFAAMAVNLMVERLGGWIWGGGRDGGEWLPNNAIARVFARFGRPPRVEEALAQQAVPDVDEEALPQPLAAFVADQTIHSLNVREGRVPLWHVLSNWERRQQLVALDAAELRFFPAQARIGLVFDGTESLALVDTAERLVRPDDDELRHRIADSKAVTFERLMGTDSFAVTFEASSGHPDEAPGSIGVLELILSAFADGQPKSPDEVLNHVRSITPGDGAVLARLVATYLGTFACFTSPDDRVYRYEADRPHNASVPVRNIRVGEVARRARRAMEQAEEQDRRMRQFRLSERAPHMVRGHIRRLDSRRHASELQLAIARRHGLDVPVGSTFVRPHRRSG